MQQVFPPDVEVERVGGVGKFVSSGGDRRPNRVLPERDSTERAICNSQFVQLEINLLSSAVQTKPISGPHPVKVLPGVLICLGWPPEVGTILMLDSMPDSIFPVLFQQVYANCLPS